MEKRFKFKKIKISFKNSIIYSKILKRKNILELFRITNRKCNKYFLVLNGIIKNIINYIKFRNLDIKHILIKNIYITKDKTIKGIIKNSKGKYSVKNKRLCIINIIIEYNGK